MSAEKRNSKNQLEERRGQVRPGGEQERRGYIRTQTSVPLTLYVKKIGSSDEIATETRNISATGMMVETDKKLSVNLEAKIDLNPPNSPNPIHLRGRVIWSNQMPGVNGYISGIEFIRIEEDNKNTFLKFLCDAIYKSARNL